MSNSRFGSKVGIDIDYQINRIDNLINTNNNYKSEINRITQQILKLNAKRTKISYELYKTNLYGNLERNLNELKEQKITYQVLRVKIQGKYDELLVKRDKLSNVEIMTAQKRLQLSNLERLLRKCETALSKLEILYQTQLELGELVYSAISHLNSFYMSRPQSSLQGLAAAAVPEERVRKLSPKSRKIFKILKKNTENVYIPNDSLGSSPETSPETAAEYVKRTSYAITKKSARSRKQRYKK